MEVINGINVHFDCLHFRGDLPCKPHKKDGYHCTDCPAYQAIQTRILIIKLGAIGDVIRTTPLVRKIRAEYPNAKITWLTHTPNILPASEIDEILKYDFASVLYVRHTKFDLMYNLDKDKDACALSLEIQADQKFGYTLKNGMPYPANQLAEHKFSTGLFDDVSKANTKSYVREIFEMSGWEFAGEEYLFDNHADKGYTWDFRTNKKKIGLNTGCGDRWTTRLWPNEHWLQLIDLLSSSGFEPVLLGGEQEHSNNLILAENGKATYFGHFGLPQFINLVHQMDLVVTQVTMAMHISVALQKKMILMNNIFNPHEFELYGRGEIVSPTKKCECYFLGKCKFGSSCMKELEPNQILQAVLRHIS